MAWPVFKDHAQMYSIESWCSTSRREDERNVSELVQL